MRPPNLASRWIRLGANLLNGLLRVVRLGTGYLNSTMVSWRRGANPAKNLPGLTVVHAGTAAGGLPAPGGPNGCLPPAFACLPVGGVLVALLDVLLRLGARHQSLVDAEAPTSVVRA